MSSPLADEPFSFQAGKDGKVRLYARGRLVKTLKGKQGLRFLERAERLSGEGLQLLLAKATGQFKFGNETRQGRD